MTANEFVNLVSSECKKHSVRFYRSRGRTVRSPGGNCRGWFGEDDYKPNQMVLAVATGDSVSKWLPILVHEFCHMHQWLEKDPTYTRSDEATGLLWEWLEGKIELSPKKAKHYAVLTLENELDCERRAVKLIKKLNLAINVDKYIKQANAYVYFYHLVAKHRRWYSPGKSPDSFSMILKAMPSSLRGDRKVISMKLEKLFEKHLGWA